MALYGIMRGRSLLVVILTLFWLSSSADCLFDRLNEEVHMKSNSTLALRSLRYRRNSSTRVAIYGNVGDVIHLICNIAFSTYRESRLRRRGIRRGPHRCSDDYFYIGYDAHRKIRGSRYFCGRKTLRKHSKPTTNLPVIVIATSSTRRGLYGEYKCKIRTTSVLPLPDTRPGKPDGNSDNGSEDSNGNSDEDWQAEGPENGNSKEDGNDGNGGEGGDDNDGEGGEGGEEGEEGEVEDGRGGDDDRGEDGDGGGQ